MSVLTAPVAFFAIVADETVIHTRARLTPAPACTLGNICASSLAVRGVPSPRNSSDFFRLLLASCIKRLLLLQGALTATMIWP